MVIAVFGQERAAASTFARSSSGGSSWSTYKKSSSRTSKTSGAAAMHNAFDSHWSKSTMTRIRESVPSLEHPMAPALDIGLLHPPESNGRVMGYRFGSERTAWG